MQPGSARARIWTYTEVRNVWFVSSCNTTSHLSLRAPQRPITAFKQWWQEAVSIQKTDRVTWFSFLCNRSVLPEPGHQSEPYVKTNSLFFPCRPPTPPLISSSTKHSRGLATAGLFFQPLQTNTRVVTRLPPRFLRQSTSVGIKQVIGTSPGPVWWSRTTCQYPQLPRSPHHSPRTSTLTRTS